MMTYAGSPLTLVNEFLLPRIQRWWDISAPDLWSYPGYALEGMHHLPVPDRPKTPNRARLNVLYWPTGASRWGVFHGLVDSGAATAIQTATGGYGGAPTSANLILQDETQDGSVVSRTVTASMFLLAIRPVFVLGDSSLYWITLVDRRYYYWLQDPTYTFTDGDSWVDLLTALNTAAGGPTLSGTPSVHADYGAPNFSRWNLIGKPLPLLMDAAAKQVGLRYIINLDGTSASYVSYATAKMAADQVYLDAHDAKQIALGGENAKVLTNATGIALSMIGNVPDSVVVKFWATSGDPADYDTETVTLSSLSLTQYSGLTGVSGATGIIMADQEASVSSPAQVAYATQAATDYYLWLLSLNDFVTASIFAFESTGLEDRIEWEYLSPREASARTFVGTTSNSQADIQDTRPIRLLTRIVPFDWHDNATYGGAPISGGSSGDVEKPWIQLTETTGPSSWNQLYSKTSTGTWPTTGTSGTNDARPFEIDGNVFTPKPTAKAILFSGVYSGDVDSGYGYLPIQSADRVASVDYPGYVVPSNQTWNGNKTFADAVYINLDLNSGTNFTVWVPSVVFPPPAPVDVLTVASPGPSISPATPLAATVSLGADEQVHVPIQGTVYQTSAWNDNHSGFVWKVSGANSVESGSVGYEIVATNAHCFTITRDDTGEFVRLFCGGTNTCSIYGAGSTFRAENGVFDTSCFAYDYTTLEHVGPFAQFTGGTASNGVGGYYFLNGLYITGGVTGSFP